MTQIEKPTRPSGPERPSPMQSAETPLTFKRTIELLTPRWAKRSSRRGRSS
jgi:hypothetical protein